MTSQFHPFPLWHLLKAAWPSGIYTSTHRIPHEGTFSNHPLIAIDGVNGNPGQGGGFEIGFSDIRGGEISSPRWGVVSTRPSHLDVIHRQVMTAAKIQKRGNRRPPNPSSTYSSFPLTITLKLTLRSLEKCPLVRFLLVLFPCDKRRVLEASDSYV